MSRNQYSASEYLSFSQPAADSMSRAKMFDSISSLAGGVAGFSLQQPGAQRDMASIFG
jgi:hypothetical protein